VDHARRKRSRWLAPALKAALAALLIAWMIYRGKLHFGDVAQALRRWPDLLAIAALYYGCLLLMSARWHVLLISEKIPIRFRETFALTMIGQFFNVLIPSSVGGDVVKGYYVMARATGKRAEALTTLLIDRGLGMLVLFLSATAGALWNLDAVLQNRSVALFCISIFAITAAGVIGVLVAIVFSPSIRRSLERLPAATRLAGVLRVFETYRRAPATILKAVAINLPGPVLATAAFLFAMRSLGVGEIPFGVLLFIVPLGLVSLAIPVTPAGIGVGQVAFYTLFTSFAEGRGVDGSNAFTVYQFVTLVVYLSGLFFYLPYKRSGAIDTEAMAAAD
jgi:uncharacterized protein (TIRG00374 family)